MEPRWGAYLYGTSSLLQPTLLHRVAGDHRHIGGEKFRPLLTAAGVGMGTARMKRTAARRIDRIRNFAFDRLALAAGHVEVRHRVEQHAGVRMARAAE